MATPLVRIHLQILILASSLVPFHSICLHEPTHHQLCVRWLMVETDDCSLTFVNQNWNLKPQIRGIWKVTVKVTIIMENRKKEEDEGRHGTLKLSKCHGCPPVGTVSLFRSMSWCFFGWWAHVAVSTEPWIALSVRAIIYLTLTASHKANLDFPEASVLKHLSNFKLQAKLDRLTKFMSSYYCDSEVTW